MKCPECGGNIDLDLKDKKFIFCPYCGNQIYLDDENREIKITEHKIDEAKIAREKRKTMETIGSYVLITVFVIALILCGILFS